MINVNNAGQQPRLDIDLNVEYRAEDDDAANDVRVGGSGTPHAAMQEVGRSISQIRVISDSAQTSFSMGHSVPQAQTSLRAPSAQAIDAGRIVVSIENAHQRISVTSSLPPASSSEVRCERPGSQSSWLSFASSSFASLNNVGQSSETSEGLIPNNIPRNKKTHPVPVALRKPGETDETRISRKALSKRQLVPVPEALRFEGETDQTRISRNSLSMRRLVPIPEKLRLAGETDETRISSNSLRKRRLVPVPEALRLEGETDETRISSNALSMRQLAPVPEALRLEGETDETRISKNTLSMRRLVSVPEALRLEGETDQTRVSKGCLHRRKYLVSVPEALRESGETDDTKIFLQILRNRKRAAKQNSAEIKKGKRS